MADHLAEGSDGEAAADELGTAERAPSDFTPSPSRAERRERMNRRLERLTDEQA